MSVASGDLGEITGGHVKIGAESHVGRNVGIVVGVVGVGAGNLRLHVVLEQAGHGQAGAARELPLGVRRQVRGAVVPCEASSLLKDTYLRSERLQAAVDKQQAALAGGAPCDEVARALKAADFPMPQPSSSVAQ